MRLPSVAMSGSENRLEKRSIPVQPTAHHAMGGLPTNIDGQVIYDRAKEAK